MTKKRKTTRREAMARGYLEMNRAIDTMMKHPFVYTADIDRVLASVVADWKGVSIRVEVGPKV